MNKAVYLLFKDEKCDIGDSKFFGAPDLPQDFEWPVDEDDFDMEFICQINCAEASEYTRGLPRTGMLYFFGCIAAPLGCEDAPPVSEGFQSMGNFSVIYSDAPASDLESGELVDENGEPAGFRELKISFTHDEDQCVDALHQLCGDFPGGEELRDYELLFCLDSFYGDDFNLEFDNSGYLYFLIKKEKLTVHDFSEVICYLSV